MHSRVITDIELNLPREEWLISAVYYVLSEYVYVHADLLPETSSP